MSFPSQGFSSLWRNHIDDVRQLLQTYHPDSFLILNLSEEGYDYDKFDNQIIEMPFPDHHAPPLHLLFNIIKMLDSWINAAPRNVAVIHCKGGKGRTGVVVVSWLLYGKWFPDIVAAAQHFAKQRSSTEKGVTQPSQVRYLKYFQQMLAEPDLSRWHSRAVRLKTIKVCPFARDTQVYFKVFDHTTSAQLLDTLESSPAAVHPIGDRVECKLDVDVRDDVLIRCLVVGKEKEIFHIIFNTMFIEVNEPLHVETFMQDSLDNAKKLSKETSVQLVFGPVCTNVPLHNNVVDDVFQSMIRKYQQAPPRSFDDLSIPHDYRPTRTMSSSPLVPNFHQNSVVVRNATADSEVLLAQPQPKPAAVPHASHRQWEVQPLPASLSHMERSPRLRLSQERTHAGSTPAPFQFGELPSPVISPSPSPSPLVASPPLPSFASPPPSSFASPVPTDYPATDGEPSILEACSAVPAATAAAAAVSPPHTQQTPTTQPQPPEQPLTPPAELVTSPHQEEDVLYTPPQNMHSEDNAQTFPQRQHQDTTTEHTSQLRLSGYRTPL
eukprot:TRINITY_DN6268_c0_g1_i1.p1 TRINITY_DN6268_c0_g1~~TRINITY_DN6268_c0_g1_i1.p1  ORF type:complete len:591 (+),score=125.23 TRINITY_DN6268_c0_g1_i1:125-1774(+)